MRTPREIAEAVLSGKQPAPDTREAEDCLIAPEFPKAPADAQAFTLQGCEWCPRQFLRPVGSKVKICAMCALTAGMAEF
ncbi:MAG: hypothetical protein AB7O65_14295 [Candidatus Korobacteraceae bacterium]